MKSKWRTLIVHSRIVIQINKIKLNPLNLQISYSYNLYILSTPLFCYLAILVINQLKMTTLNGYNAFDVAHQFGNSAFIVNYKNFN